MNYNVQKTVQHLIWKQHFMYIAAACTIRYGWQAKPKIIVGMKGDTLQLCQADY
jgi:hypothetical protein